MAARIIDVAKHAGVSSATVSRVINNPEKATEKTRNKVLRAIEELGYQPRTSRNKADGLPLLMIIIDQVEVPFFLSIIAGIIEQAEKEELVPMIIHLGDKKTDQLAKLRQISCLSINGVISAGYFQSPDDWKDFYNVLQVPMVLVNTKVYHPNISSIAVDFEKGAYRGTQHLLELGHTRIAFLGISDKYPEFSQKELQGVKRALKEKDIIYPPEYDITVLHNPEGASQGISRLMMLPPEKRPTAIFAFDDELAIYAINSIRHHGLRIPEDISIIGFDNIEMAMHTNPPLTTIDVPKYRIGRQAVRLITQLSSNGKDNLGFTYIQESLVVRESTGPAPNHSI